MCERRNQRVSATSTYCACVQHFESQDAVALAAIRDMLAWQGPYFVREREREKFRKRKRKRDLRSSLQTKIFTSDMVSTGFLHASTETCLRGSPPSPRRFRARWGAWCPHRTRPRFAVPEACRAHVQGTVLLLSSNGLQFNRFLLRS